jgi:hypothetical protein
MCRIWIPSFWGDKGADLDVFGLPDPDPLVKEVWIRILPFSQKGVERTEIMLAK